MAHCEVLAFTDAFTRTLITYPSDGLTIYGSMSGDESRNHQRILWFTNGVRGLWDEAPPEEALQRISPASYLERISAAVSIHHGEFDEQVPLRGRRSCASNCRPWTSRWSASPTPSNPTPPSEKGISSSSSG